MKLSAIHFVLSIASLRAPTSFVDAVCAPDAPGQCADPNHCCSKWGFCGADGAWCGVDCVFGPCDSGPIGPTGPTPPAPTPTPPPPTPTSPPPPGPSNYNYCGDSWTLASQACGATCYDGTPTPCPSGQSCFADVTNCPAVTDGPPPPTGPTTPQPTRSPVPAPSPTGPTGGPPVAVDDSRLIAYLGNWQSCPTADQYDAYTHIVIAFAVSYTWSTNGNNCDAQCNIASSVPICNNAPNQPLVDTWRTQGKKVILSFGGAGMGGSWSGDPNNCWDYCFGEEEPLSTALVNIVSSQNFDGVDIDYEYCYDKDSGRHSGCNQVTNLYSDAAAQNFLAQMTFKLREKLDALGSGYELTHAPMDSDMVQTSPYFQLLKDQSANLNFLMPQFYNGITNADTDGFDGTGFRAVSASQVYNNIANVLFLGRPDKVVFGFCISDCAGQGSNVDGPGAAEVMRQVKAYNSEEFACNGGAFFWVAENDTGGLWSDAVSAEVSPTSGCSNTNGTPVPTTSPTPGPTTSPTPGPTTSPTTSPTASPTKSPVTQAPTTSPTKSPVLAFPGTCSDNSGQCSATDMSQCTCAPTRLRNLKGKKEVEAKKGGLRKLARKTPNPVAPVTPPPTRSPVAATPGPTGSPSMSPTQSPTKSPTPFECTCVLPTPEPTSSPTQPATPNPTASPTLPPIPPSDCSCGQFRQKNFCEAGCGSTCSWSGRSKSCVA